MVVMVGERARTKPWTGTMSFNSSSFVCARVAWIMRHVPSSSGRPSRPWPAQGPGSRPPPWLGRRRRLRIRRGPCRGTHQSRDPGHGSNNAAGGTILRRWNRSGVGGGQKQAGESEVRRTAVTRFFLTARKVRVKWWPLFFASLV